MRTPSLWVSPEQVAQARNMDLLTYLQTYEPHELVALKGGTFATRTNDSLKISNGKWMRWSTGDGGKSALDYLIKVRGMGFQDAVLQICGLSYSMPPPSRKPEPVKEQKPFALPEPHTNNDRVLSYLKGRGIDDSLLVYCIRAGKIYESAKHHNCVFVGFDDGGTPRHAMQRSSNPRASFKNEVEGSDKRFSFSMLPVKDTACVHVFESAIDLLSFLTLERMGGRDISDSAYLSLNGVYLPRKQIEESTPPAALAQFLKSHPKIKTIFPCLDRDNAGYGATKVIQTLYGGSYAIYLSKYPKLHDYNDQLKMEKGIRQMEKDAHER